MIARIAVVVLTLALVACGVKTDLEPPPGAIPQKGEPDASKPQKPLGQ
jgi:predicted small lipoprotein YifL